MTPPDRIYAIKSLLERRGCVPLSAIMERLEVSRATAKRDIEFLRDRMGVPIKWDAFDRGYRIAPAEAGPRAPAREFPGLWFTDGEIAGLLTLGELLVLGDDTGFISHELHPLRQRLQRMLGNDRVELEGVLQRARAALLRDRESSLEA